MLLSGADKDKSAELAEELRAKIQAYQLFIQDQVVSTTISVGVCSRIPGLGDQKEIMLKKADEALYYSMENGRNQVSFCDL